MPWKELPLSECKISCFVDVLHYRGQNYNLKPLLFLSSSAGLRKPWRNFSHIYKNHSPIGCLFIVGTSLLPSVWLFSTLKISFWRQTAIYVLRNRFSHCIWWHPSFSKGCLSYLWWIQLLYTAFPFPWRLSICLPCYSCICCIGTFKLSISLSRLAISWCKLSLVCSNSFSFSLPTREPTPLAMVVSASVATLLSVSVHISGFAF